MNTDILADRLFESLIHGDRNGARSIIELSRENLSPEEIISEVFWVCYQQIEQLFRGDKLPVMAHNASTKLLRTLVDQEAARCRVAPANGSNVLAFCGPTDPDELAAQIATDAAERLGYEVRFHGGGIPGDEIIEQVQTNSPDVLMIFASSPQDLPEIRNIIDTLGEIGASRSTQIVVGGGVFARASGLAEEIGADLWSDDPFELAEMMFEEPECRATPDQRTVGKGKIPTAKAA